MESSSRSGTSFGASLSIVWRSSSLRRAIIRRTPPGSRFSRQWRWISGDRLVLTVRDNGPGVERNAGAGVGLANTRARLAQLYADQSSLSLSSAPGGGAISEIALPFHTAADLRTEEFRYDN